MRTIKYRQPVFNPDKSFKEYHYWGIIDLIGEGVKQWIPPITAKYYVDVKITNPADSEQFTGLTDKNGKEIYEGDILGGGHLGFVCPVTYSDGCFQLRTNESQGNSHITQDRVGRLQVLGNIHQNPENLCQK